MTQDKKPPKTSRISRSSKTPPEGPPDPPVDPENPLDIKKLRLEYRDPRTLTPNPLNFRQHGGRQRQTMADIIKDVGMITGIVYNERSGHVIDGHMRLQEFIEQNAEEIPVVICDLSDQEEANALLYFDRVQQMAGIDREKELRLARIAEAEEESLQRLREEVLGGQSSTEDDETDQPDGPEDRYGVGLVPGEGFHYVVLLFRTELDWYAATDHFQLERQQDAFRPSLQKLQVVVDGGKYLERIRGAE